MSRLTGLVTDPIYQEHQTGQHPENPYRLRAILERLQADDVWDQFELISATPADRELIELIHDPEYITSLETQIAAGALFVGSMDCIVSSRSFEVAENAVGGMLTLVKKVQRGELKNGFGLVRPPGHHAERDQALGFCYFNNIAICAEYLAKREGLQRILIVDYDVHHGNGTQHSFEDRSDIFYCSVHEDPSVCYPGTGRENEKGRGKGKNYTLNVPMLSRSGDEEYQRVLEDVLIPAWRDYKPEFVLVSVGFDAHRDDPLAGINITDVTYKAYAKALCDIADEFCSGKLVSFLEGGYNLEVIPELALLHSRILVNAANAQPEK